MILNVLFISICLTLTLAQSFKEPAVTQLTETFNIGESPVWDERVGKLYFVDIHHGRIVAYDFEQQTSKVIAEFPGNDITPFVLTNDPNVFIAGINKNLTKITLNGDTVETVVLNTVQNDKDKIRFNDGKADSMGRLWIGTIDNSNQKFAALFKFTKENITNPSIEIPQVGISNGLAWSRDNTKFYYIDTTTSEIAQYDFDVEAGIIKNRKVVFNAKEFGHPDGMTIDEEDNLWIALWDGGSVIHVNPSTGTLLRTIPIPARYTTSVAWGGPKMDILFVTTAKRSLTTEELRRQPGAGSLYAITNLGTKGRPDFKADISMA